MRERRRDYELMFIISPLRSSEEDITTATSRVHQSITAAGGTVSTTDQGPPWGRRKFAYPIREYAEGEASRRAFSEGFYVLCHFNLPAAGIPEVERALKLNDAVLRYLLTLVDARGQGLPTSSSVAIGTDTPGRETRTKRTRSSRMRTRVGRGIAGARSGKAAEMAKDLNKVMVIGRLGKDPEMRYTAGGSPVTTFSVAAEPPVERRFR